MSKTKTKFVLSHVQTIPLNKLTASDANVRRVKNGVSIEDLAADIAHRGMLQNLNVRPVLDGDGAETGTFHVLAGGRRLKALQLLVQQKRIAKAAEIPCNVKPADDPISAEEDSLAENTFRAGLHPLDEFRAFKDLADQGLGHDTIAARFRTTPRIVQQRLRLAAVSPKLHEVFAADAMTLEQLMAFTLTDDHARQEQVWQIVSDRPYDADAHSIRAMLTEETVESEDRRVLFVGLEAYKAAGGTIVADLFAEDDDCYLEDPALLDTLCTDKLKAAAEALRPEGWKWIAVAVSFPYGHDAGMRRLAGRLQELTESEQAEREALREEFDRLEAEYSQADEYPDDVDARLGEIEAQLEALENRPRIFDPSEIAHAGVFISIDHHGKLQIARGYVRDGEKLPQPAPDEDDAIGEDEEDGISRTVITVGGAPEGDGEDDAEEGLKPLADRLVSELTAHRTLALQDAVANHPHVAMTALLHTLCLDAFYHASGDTCLNAYVRRVYPPIQAADLKESPPAQALTARQESWKTALPQNPAVLWEHLTTLGDDARMGLLAHCVSHGVSALHERAGQPGGSVSGHTVERRIAQANRLARAVGLDMVEVGWRPTAANYLSRVPKTRILEAVREAKGEQSAQLLGHLKKDEMAKEAERLLDGTGWLPEPLRLPDTDPVEDAQADALPAFLDDEEDEDADAPEDSDAVAAE
jgi:ParB family chromosome partitioning protein